VRRNRHILRRKIHVKYAVALLATLIFTAVSAETIRIPWKGDYPHNSSRTWSKDNPYDSGFSKNFKNGTPEEFGDVQKDGELNAEIIIPKGTTGPIPFMVVLHGCTGLETLAKEWAHHVAEVLNAEGIGALILDSYTTRYVNGSCGNADLHWGRRRADDAYSALDYLIERKLAKPDEVYVTGISNGGTAALVAMTKTENDHKYRFAAGFPIVPSCISVTVKYGDYYNPMIVFAADHDDANLSALCVEMLKKKRATPVQLVLYQGANHGFMEKAAPHVFNGWHLSYSEADENDMMKTIVSAINKKIFKKGIEVRKAD
jgi:dienelactone hydrolase